MKTITIHVSEPVYREFQALADKEKRSTAELILESMNLYLKTRRPAGHSLLDLKPFSVGKVKKQFRRSDLADEMFGR